MPQEHEELTEEWLQKFEAGFTWDGSKVAQDVAALVREVRWLRNQCIQQASAQANILASQAKFIADLKKKLKEASHAKRAMRPKPVAPGNPVGKRDQDQDGARPFGPDPCEGRRG